MKKSIFWFTNDLRLHDQVALKQAIDRSEYILPVYCFDPRHFGLQHLGMPKTGAFRAKFILEAVGDLKSQLQSIGSDLYVAIGKPEQVIPSLCRMYAIDAVYASKEVTTEETAVEEALEAALRPLKVPLHLVWQSTLYHIDDIPWPIKNLPNIFTNFRKECERECTVRSAIAAPKHLPTLVTDSWGVIPTLAQLGLNDLPSVQDSRAVLKFKGGERTALDRLKTYFWEGNHLKEYKNTRNGMLGADYSSKFSPWLALGCISPRYIYEQVQQYEQMVVKNDSTYWLVFELIWRDYFRFVCRKYGSAVFHLGGIRGEITTPRQDMQAFRAWCEGQTGVPFIDANMRELAATGFMSNRGRQNVASFFVKDLRLDWRWGAAWFESLLIDHDPCSNYGNWNYVAGIGNDPREDRYFNIMSQAQRYDPKGEYVRTWCPELAAIPGTKIHSPSELPKSELQQYGVGLGMDYPRPIVSFKKWLVGR